MIEIGDRVSEIAEPLVHQAAVGIDKADRVATQQFVEIGERLVVGAFRFIGDAAIETRHGPLIVGARLVLDDAGAGGDLRVVIADNAAIGEILHRRRQHRPSEQAGDRQNQ